MPGGESVVAKDTTYAVGDFIFVEGEDTDDFQVKAEEINVGNGANNTDLKDPDNWWIPQILEFRSTSSAGTGASEEENLQALVT